MPLLPTDHPERTLLADEVHARPYDLLDVPIRASHVAVLVDHDQREHERERIAELCRAHGVAPPDPTAIHFIGQLGALSLKWERHGEFSGYTFLLPGVSGRPFEHTAAAAVPAGWIAGIPGQTVFAAHAELVPAADAPPDAGVVSEWFEGNVPVGSEIADGSALVYTDFRIHADGFERFRVLSRQLTPREAGRMLQRLFEIEAYRMLALLALPIARGLGPRIVAFEAALRHATEGIARAGGDDELLLGEVTRLAADVENALVSSQFRFGASRAYHDLVRTRIGELRESRLPGAQSIQGFMNRRLTPAMATCVAMSQRLRELSDRVAQASTLLSARVDIMRKKQNQALLASMERHARHQLMLQQTVEGLSVAAITYYAVGLIAYAAKGLKSAGVDLDPSLVTGLAIPLVGGLVFLSIRRARRHLTEAD